MSSARSFMLSSSPFIPNPISASSSPIIISLDDSISGSKSISSISASATSDCGIIISTISGSSMATVVWPSSTKGKGLPSLSTSSPATISAATTVSWTSGVISCCTVSSCTWVLRYRYCCLSCQWRLLHRVL